MRYFRRNIEAVTRPILCMWNLDKVFRNKCVNIGVMDSRQYTACICNERISWLTLVEMLWSHRLKRVKKVEAHDLPRQLIW